MARPAKQARARSRLLAAALFIANIVYVATGRTTLVVMAVLLLLFGLRQFGWKGALGACLVGGVLAGAAVGLLALSARARIDRRRAGADPWHRRHHHAGRTAARVLEEIARIHRRGAGDRPWNRNDPDAVPARCRPPRPLPTLITDQSAQPGSGGGDPARPRRRRRADRDVDRPSRAVSRRHAVAWFGLVVVCRTSSDRCSTRTCSTSARAGSMSSASASPAGWCCGRRLRRPKRGRKT